MHSHYFFDVLLFFMVPTCQLKFWANVPLMQKFQPYFTKERLWGSCCHFPPTSDNKIVHYEKQTNIKLKIQLHAFSLESWSHVNNSIVTEQQRNHNKKLQNKPTVALLHLAVLYELQLTSHYSCPLSLPNASLPAHPTYKCAWRNPSSKGKSFTLYSTSVWVYIHRHKYIHMGVSL